ncbi:MAG TPA: hypothetical protein VG409_04175 [Actinomycetota bacterium]|nr:hypothetical protein [Actinomycetota bacterium]
MMELPAEPVRPGASRPEAARLPALARYWWLTAVRGLVALTLALAIVVAGRGTDRLVTFLGLYWMAGGLITLRFALAVRPRRGARLALVAGLAAVVGALLVLLRHGLAGLVQPELLVELVGVSAVLTGLLRVVGGFAAEKQLGRRWTIGGVVLGTLEAALGVLLLASTEVRPEVIWPVAAAWGVVSGSLLLAEGVRLRRFARAST